MSLLQTIVAFIVALGVLIVVHEYGHYIVARLCGVKVLRFSVGFGRALATWRLGADRTEWVVAAIPFGGYVKMLDEREGPVEPAELERGFPSADVEADVLERVGLRLYRPPLPPLLGQIVPGGAAERAGLAAGDRIVRADGTPIETWEAFVNAVRSKPGAPLSLTIERAG